MQTEADHLQKGFDLIQERDKLRGHQRPLEVPSLWMPLDVTPPMGLPKSHCP